MQKPKKDQIEKVCNEMLQRVKKADRKYVETISLQFAIKNYDRRKDKSIYGTVHVVHPPKLSVKICYLGDLHTKQAEALGIPFMTCEEVSTTGRNTKFWEKRGLRY